MASAGMWPSRLGIGRWNRIFVALFVLAFGTVYAILAFHAMQHTSITTKSECNCPDNQGVVNEAVQNALRIAPRLKARARPKVTSTTTPPMQSLTTNYTDLPNTTAVEKIGEFLKFAGGKGVIVLEHDFKASNTTDDVEPPPKKPAKVEFWKHKYYHVAQADPDGKRIDGSQLKGIVTRFGFIAQSAIDDHAFLSKHEVKKLSEMFVYDKFINETLSHSTEDVLTFGNSTNRYANWTDGKANNIVKRPLCPISVPGLKRQVPLGFSDLTPPTFMDIHAANPNVKFGGKFSPKCHPRSKIAIIIPFRGRESQLRVLLAHMHPIWQRQQIEYTVYTISQADDGGIFNKAKLLNIGFLEARKYDTYDCYVFHDVDMTLEDDRCLYRCPDSDNARELSVYLDKFNYQELKYHLNCRPRSYPEHIYAKYFGGVSMVTEKQMLDVNGYSNLFWGWGSEDIDMYLRLWRRGYKILQPYGRSCSYHMIKHETEAANRQNNGRFALLANSINRMRYEGLTSIRYKIIEVEENPVYTNITVDVGQPKNSLATFMNKSFSTFERQCSARLPWQ